MEFEIVEDLADHRGEDGHSAPVWDWPMSGEPSLFSAQDRQTGDHAICIPEQEDG